MNESCNKMKDQTWAVYSANSKTSRDFTHKRHAYNECRRQNGKRADGEKPFHVQRGNVRGKK